MLSKNDVRLESLPLSSVAFYAELPALLGVSQIYVHLLVRPPKTKSGDKFRALKFPRPFFTSRSGVRIWWVRDLERWAWDIRRQRRVKRIDRLGSTLLDRPELADLLLGRIDPH